MLFGYPVAATTENWLHDTILEIVRNINDAIITAGTLPSWPDIIPANRRERLITRRGLQERLNEYVTAFRALSTDDQQAIIAALDFQNRIPELLSGACDCAVLNELPRSIHLPLRNLFDFAFELLTPLEIRDKQYKCIYDQGDRLCPFCGCEYFDAPCGPREALDHFLAKSIYPCASANLRNLVPMGPKCNSRYKGDVDILRKDGSRRKVFDPYGSASIQVNLDKSVPFGSHDGKTPQWQIDFSPSTEEAATWDDVFEVRTRYDRDILTPCFSSWLDQFRSWCESASMSPSTVQELLNCLTRYIKFLGHCGFSDRAFLKVAVFKMLHLNCNSGNSRLIKFLLELVNT